MCRQIGHRASESNEKRRHFHLASVQLVPTLWLCCVRYAMCDGADNLTTIADAEEKEDLNDIEDCDPFSMPFLMEEPRR